MARLPSSSDFAWLGRVRDELATLPETLKAFRETVEDLRRVAKRLEAISELMERTQTHLDALGVTDAARQFDDAVVAVERQVAAVRNSVAPGKSGVLDDAVSQLMRTAGEVSDLGWRMFGGRPSPGSVDPAGDDDSRTGKA